MSEIIGTLVFSLVITAPLWIPEYKRWKFNKYVDENYSIYDFKCPNCSAESDKLKVINFDNCCHGFSVYEVNGKYVSKGYAGSQVVCGRCKQIMHILYFIDDLENNSMFELMKFLEKRPKKVL